MAFVYTEPIEAKRRRSSKSERPGASKTQKSFRAAREARLETLESTLGVPISSLNKNLLRQAWSRLFDMTGVGPSDTFSDERTESYREILDAGLAQLAVVALDKYDQERMRESLQTVGMGVLLKVSDSKTLSKVKRQIDTLYDEMVPDGQIIGRGKDGQASKMLYDPDLGQLSRPPQKPKLAVDLQGETVVFTENTSMRDVVMPFLQDNATFTQTVWDTVETTIQNVRLIPAFPIKEPVARDNEYDYDMDMDVTKGVLIVDQPAEASIGFTANSQALTFGDAQRNELLAAYAISARSNMFVLFKDGTKYRKYDYRGQSQDILMSGQYGRHASFRGNKHMYRIPMLFQTHTLSQMTLDALNALMLEGFVPEPFSSSKQPEFMLENLGATLVYRKTMTFATPDASQEAFAFSVDQMAQPMLDDLQQRILGMGEPDDIEDMTMRELYNDIKKTLPLLSSKTRFYKEMFRFYKAASSLYNVKYRVLEELPAQVLSITDPESYTDARDAFAQKSDPQRAVQQLLAPLPEPLALNPDARRLYVIAERLQSAWVANTQKPFYKEVVDYLSMSGIIMQMLTMASTRVQPTQEQLEEDRNADRVFVNSVLQDRGVKRRVLDKRRKPLVFNDVLGRTLQVKNDNEFITAAKGMLRVDMKEFNKLLWNETFNGPVFDQPLKALEEFLEEILSLFEPIDVFEPYGPYQDFSVLRRDAVNEIQEAFARVVMKERKGGMTLRKKSFAWV
jgi:hypothetical protein